VYGVLITGRSSRTANAAQQPCSYIRFSRTNFSNRTTTCNVPINQSFHKPCTTATYESFCKSYRSSTTWDKRRLLQVWNSGWWCVL